MSLRKIITVLETEIAHKKEDNSCVLRKCLIVRRFVGHECISVDVKRGKADSRKSWIYRRMGTCYRTHSSCPDKFCPAERFERIGEVEEEITIICASHVARDVQGVHWIPQNPVHFLRKTDFTYKSKNFCFFEIWDFFFLFVLQ